jgi:hypothetical protein
VYIIVNCLNGAAHCLQVFHTASGSERLQVAHDRHDTRDHVTTIVSNGATNWTNSITLRSDAHLLRDEWSLAETTDVGLWGDRWTIAAHHLPDSENRSAEACERKEMARRHKRHGLWNGRQGFVTKTQLTELVSTMWNVTATCCDKRTDVTTIKTSRNN